MTTSTWERRAIGVIGSAVLSERRCTNFGKGCEEGRTLMEPTAEELDAVERERLVIVELQRVVAELSAIHEAKVLLLGITHGRLRRALEMSDRHHQGTP